MNNHTTILKAITLKHDKAEEWQWLTIETNQQKNIQTGKLDYVYKEAVYERKNLINKVLTLGKQAEELRLQIHKNKDETMEEQ